MIDLTYLKTTTGNDTNVILELISIFTSQLPELKEGIQTYYKQKDWKNLKEIAHKAKNSFMIVGAENQADNLKKIEIISQDEKNRSQLAPLIENFLKSCEKIVEEIEQLKI